MNASIGAADRADVAASANTAHSRPSMSSGPSRPITTSLPDDSSPPRRPPVAPANAASTCLVVDRLAAAPSCRRTRIDRISAGVGRARRLDLDRRYAGPVVEEQPGVRTHPSCPMPPRTSRPWAPSPPHCPVVGHDGGELAPAVEPDRRRSRRARRRANTGAADERAGPVAGRRVGERSPGRRASPGCGVVREVVGQRRQAVSRSAARRAGSSRSRCRVAGRVHHHVHDRARSGRRRRSPTLESELAEAQSSSGSPSVRPVGVDLTGRRAGRRRPGTTVLRLQRDPGGRDRDRDSAALTGRPLRLGQLGRHHHRGSTSSTQVLVARELTGPGSATSTGIARRTPSIADCRSRGVSAWPTHRPARVRRCSARPRRHATRPTAVSCFVGLVAGEPAPPIEPDDRGDQRRQSNKDDHRESLATDAHRHLPGVLHKRWTRPDTTADAIGTTVTATPLAIISDSRTLAVCSSPISASSPNPSRAPPTAISSRSHAVPKHSATPRSSAATTT